MRKVVLVFLLIVFLPCISAMDIKLEKTDYFPGETFLAEIIGNFSEPLTMQNIFFKQDNLELGLAFYLLKISNQQYYVWVNLPQKPGNYSFGFENIIYKEDGKLSGKTKQAGFMVNPSIALEYKELIQDVKGKWNSVNTETNALALLALAWDDNLASSGLDALNEKINSESECWPSSCRVKDTALAVLAKEKAGDKPQGSWLQDAQNNLGIGLWDFSINSISSQICHLQINDDIIELNLTIGTNIISIDLKNKPEDVTIKTNCSGSSAKIVHTYLGSLNKFQMQEQNNMLKIVLNNRKCFGQTYRSSCDIESSAFAGLAISKLGLSDNGLISWLKDNAAITKHKAIALYLSDSSGIKEWIINNQHQDGFWSRASLLESELPDFESTLFSVLALEKRKSISEGEKGRIWLKEQIQKESINNKALVLAFIFLPEQIEPIIAVSPAAKSTATNNTLNIEIENKGASIVEITATLEPFNIKKTISILSDDYVILDLEVPDKIGKEEIENSINGSIMLSYTTDISDKKGDFRIPLVILPKKEIKEPEITILLEHFSFMPSRIDGTLLKGEIAFIKILLRNSAQKAIEDVSISYTRSLNEILDIQPIEIESIEPGSSEAINLTIMHNKIENFFGEIIAGSASQNITARIPLSIIFTDNESLVEMPPSMEDVEENKTCKDFNGTICQKDYMCDRVVVKRGEERCCFGKCIKESNNTGRIIGIVMIILAVGIIAAFIFLKMKKPKKQERDIYREIENKYSHFGKKIEPKG